MLPIELESLKQIKIKDLEKSRLIPGSIVNILMTNKVYTLWEVLVLTEEDTASFNNFGKKKKLELKELQLNLQNNPETYINYYNMQNNDVIIITPDSKDDQPFYKLIEDILHKLENIFSKKKKTQLLAKIIPLYFGFEGRCFDKKEIADELQKTEERTRQLIKKVTNLFSGKSVENIKVEEGFIKKLNNIKTESLYTPNFSKNISGSPHASKDKLERIAELINCTLINVDDYSILIEKGNQATPFREHYLSINRILRNASLPLSIPELESKIEEDLPGQINLNKKTYKTILLNFKQFEILSDKEEVQIRWQNLSSLTAKIERILFEIKKGVNRDELLLIFNERAQNAGEKTIEKNQLIVKNLDEAFLQQDNGYYKYLGSNAHPSLHQKDIKGIIKDFIIQKNGKVYFEEVKQHICNYNLEYADSTIRNYILSFCCVSKNDNNLFIHDSFISRYPRIEVKTRRQKDVKYNIIQTAIAILKDKKNNSCKRKSLNKEIQKVLEDKGISINSQNLNYYINQFTDSDENPKTPSILIATNNENEKEIKLDVESLKSYIVDRIGRQTSPPYQRKIRSLAINHLKNCSDYKCSLSNLKKEFLKYLPKGYAQTNFSKIFEDTYYFEKTKDGNSNIIHLRPEHLPISKDLNEELNEPEISKEPHFNEVRYTETNIQQEYVHAYNRTPYNWQQLKEQLKKELKNPYYKFSDEELEKGLDEFYNNLLGENETDRWGNSLLQTIYDIWFFKSDFYDREAYLIKITHGYETFIKGFIKENTESSGMASIIANIVPLQNLKEYKFEAKRMDKYAINQRELTFSKILGTLIFYGNQFRHDARNENLDFGMFNQVKLICDFIALYIYSAVLISPLKEKSTNFIDS